MGSHAVSVVVADFNGDGINDLAVANYGDPIAQDQGVTIFLGKGDGTFQAVPNYIVSANSLAVGDFNADGIVDLAVSGGQALTILLGKGDGTFNASPLSSVGDPDASE